jgi:hypothetical protein
MFLDIIHRPDYFSKRNISNTGFCLRLQVVIASNLVEMRIMYVRI